MKNKEITAEKFSEFLAWLNPDAEMAGIEYERLQFRLINYFVNRNCRFPEELADETINRLILKIGEKTVENKTAFVYGFAKNICLESLRKEKSHLNIDELNVPEKHNEAETDFSGDCLEKCLSELSAENRQIILDYFSEDKQQKIDFRKQLAEKLRLTQTALRMKILRDKRKLKICLEECMAV